MSPPFLQRLSLRDDADLPPDVFPGTPRFMRSLDIQFGSIVTFFVGQNRSGRSTVMEVIATAAVRAARAAMVSLAGLACVLALAVNGCGSAPPTVGSGSAGSTGTAGRDGSAGSMDSGGSTFCTPYTLAGFCPCGGVAENDYRFCNADGSGYAPCTCSSEYPGTGGDSGTSDASQDGTDATDAATPDASPDSGEDADVATPRAAR